MSIVWSAAQQFVTKTKVLKWFRRKFMKDNEQRREGVGMEGQSFEDFLLKA